MTNDPIVEEVRRTRQLLFEQCGSDMGRFMDFIRSSELKHAGRRISSLEEKRALLRGREESAAPPVAGR